MAVIGDKLAYYAEEHPDKLAIHTQDRKVNYQDLQTDIQQLTRKLNDLSGDLNGKKVGFLLRNGIPWLELFIAVSHSGGVAIPFDPKWSEVQLDRIVKDASPDLLVYDPVYLERFPLLKKTGIELEQLLTLPEAYQASKAAPEDLFYIGYTSGTTGEPKGFQRTHSSWADCFQEGQRIFSLSENDRILCPGPLVHSHFLYAAVQALHLGTTLYLTPAFDAYEVSEILSNERISVLYIVPTMCEAIQRITPQTQSFPLKKLISSGAKWTYEAKKQATFLFPESSIYEFYGASELSFVSVQKFDISHNTPEAIGEPFPKVTIDVRDEDGGEVLDGEVGYLFVKSPWLFAGYFNRPEETSKVFAGPWASAGDLAYKDKQGEVILIGRSQNMIISGGLNIYPEEVEQVIKAFPGIEEAVVIGVEDNYWGEKVVAVYSQSQAVEQEHLKEHCKEHLPHYKCPKEWHVTAEFPYTTSGKAARKEVEAIYGISKGEV